MQQVHDSNLDDRRLDHFPPFERVFLIQLSYLLSTTTKSRLSKSFDEKFHGFRFFFSFLFFFRMPPSTFKCIKQMNLCLAERTLGQLNDAIKRNDPFIWHRPFAVFSTFCVWFVVCVLLLRISYFISTRIDDCRCALCSHTHIDWATLGVCESAMNSRKRTWMFNLVIRATDIGACQRRSLMTRWDRTRCTAISRMTIAMCALHGVLNAVYSRYLCMRAPEVHSCLGPKTTTISVDDHKIIVWIRLQSSTINFD